MRFYFFTNYYLSSLQKGLQSGHVIGDVSVKYNKKSKEHLIYEDWAKNHKVITILNGGNSKSMIEINNLFEFLKDQGMELPFSLFKEDEESLASAETAVGIIVPQVYVNLAQQARENKLDLTDENLNLKEWEIALMQEMNKYPLAN